MARSGRLGSRSSNHVKLMALCVVAFMTLMIWSGWENPHLNLEDALFLTRNSLKEFRQSYFPKGRIHTESQGVTQDISSQVISSQDLSKELQKKSNGPRVISDIEYPINNMVNSIFPIDTNLELNTTEENYLMVGRYASFSPILSNPITGHYKTFPNSACEAINTTMPDYADYEDKILIVLRGDCTFVKKVDNLVHSDLNPKAIIIANDEPSSSLITMYSSTFNDDRSLDIPILFITNESYKIFYRFNLDNLLVKVSTAPLGNWINIIISMILSPPLLILFFYCLIQLIQNCRRLSRNKASEKIVRNLPVYIYNKNHLIRYSEFYNYLNVTSQTESLINDNSDSSSSNNSLHFDRDSHTKPTPSPSSPTLNNFKINGVDVKRSAAELGVLIMNDDFYPAFKCSICLDGFKPLKSRVLVLDCKHFFHERCLSNWLINFRRSCPLCNNSTIANVSNTSSTSLIAGQLNQPNYNTFNEVDVESHIGLDSSSNNVSEDPLINGEDEYENVYDPSSQVNDPREQEQPIDTGNIARPSTGNVVTGPLEPVSHQPLEGSSAQESSKHERESIASSTTSFFTSHSQFDSKSSARFVKPSHILSQYSSHNIHSRDNLSTSIDSELDDMANNRVTADDTIDSNTTLDSTDSTDSNSTINMSAD